MLGLRLPGFGRRDLINDLIQDAIIEVSRAKRLPSFGNVNWVFTHVS
ncbi:hypothetical protein ATL17_2482 [Maritalea mobilis]|uniref:Uncharacterized protein n=2 Tax=Maritalea TaxID=623276 RepID=A0A2R4MJF7_9HYPH|nr:hypothetical protein MXMO3_03597 [Maritalea myrionectae]TDQ64463.1 hypothetical protein ATL17_2482 [Maritalea mobilis]